MTTAALALAAAARGPLISSNSTVNPRRNEKRRLMSVTLHDVRPETEVGVGNAEESVCLPSKIKCALGG